MIHLHGGPEAQERPVYNSLFQSLVAAGIAVFAPNVRGSTGFGRTFVTADDLGRRYGAIEDVAASVAHLVSSGLADEHRVGCMGRSYGGYLTLAALVWYPELFAVGIDVCGMADFETFYRHTEPRIAAAAVSKYGDPVRDKELLRDLSPIHKIDLLTAPLLVVHGAEDTNVPVEEAQQVVDALAAREREHRFLLFEGEGHELLATPNRVAFVQAAVGWAGHHLGVG
jgi:dipeptidyl aminopeptidase/acylaminoacyl peptidase